MSATEEVHVGDIGTALKARIMEEGAVQNISAATVKKFRFKKPGGTIIEKTAEFDTDGTDGILKYETVLGDIDEAGPWEMQAYLEFPTGKWWSSRETFQVYENLDPVTT